MACAIFEAGAGSVNNMALLTRPMIVVTAATAPAWSPGLSAPTPLWSPVTNAPGTAFAL